MRRDDDRFVNENTLPSVSAGDAHGAAAGGNGGGEYLSQRGAMELARRLQAYWRDRGSDAARFWAVPIEARFPKVGSYQLYRVECNLVDGLPPDWPRGRKS